MQLYLSNIWEPSFVKAFILSTANNQFLFELYYNVTIEVSSLYILEPTFDFSYADNLEYPWEMLTIGKKLGEGGFGYVVRAEAVNICGNNGTCTVAVKRSIGTTSENNKYCAVGIKLKIPGIKMYIPAVISLNCIDI